MAFSKQREVLFPPFSVLFPLFSQRCVLGGGVTGTPSDALVEHPHIFWQRACGAHALQNCKVIPGTTPATAICLVAPEALLLGGGAHLCTQLQRGRQRARQAAPPPLSPNVLPFWGSWGE